MYFYVFIDPEIVPDAVSGGEGALDALIGILRGFRRGCLMTQTDTWEIESSLAEKITNVPDEFHFERKLIGELVMKLFMGGPWVVLETNGEDRPLIDVAVEQANAEKLDLLLTPSGVAPGKGDGWEACSYYSFNRTQFSAARDRLTNGRSFKEGDLSHDEILEQCFSKMIFHAKKITITDYSLGEHYNNTQPVNLKRWVRSIGAMVRDQNSTSLVIRTMRSAHSRSIETDIAFLRNEVDMQLVLEFTDQRIHRRFFSADAHCLNTDRGVDLCRNDGSCREFGIVYVEMPI